MPSLRRPRRRGLLPLLLILLPILLASSRAGVLAVDGRAPSATARRQLHQPFVPDQSSSAALLPHTAGTAPAAGTPTAPEQPTYPALVLPSPSTPAGSATVAPSNGAGANKSSKSSSKPVAVQGCTAPPRKQQGNVVVQGGALAGPAGKAHAPARQAASDANSVRQPPVKKGKASGVTRKQLAGRATPPTPPPIASARAAPSTPGDGAVAENIL